MRRQRAGGQVAPDIYASFTAAGCVTFTETFTALSPGFSHDHVPYAAVLEGVLSYTHAAGKSGQTARCSTPLKCWGHHATHSKTT